MNADTYSVKEACTKLGINTGTAYQMIHDGRFPVRHIRVGSRILIPRKDLDQLLGANPHDERIQRYAEQIAARAIDAADTLVTLIESGALRPEDV